MNFDWDEANVDHIAAHKVTPTEVEQVLNEEILILAEQEHEDGVYWLVLGATKQGRILVVAFTEHDDALRVATAYPATPKLRRIWRNS